ncbi:hypothetical protein BGZ73_008380 [Actinomortierella ambigua]|nr:hypothetical protein BGZ73_008380 [Actinomortierella ambigua]
MPSSDKHSHVSSDYRTTAQQQQQQQPLPPAPTLQDIERKHSQLPPQYRQALLEQQQRQHQQQLLQQQQQQQQQQPHQQQQQPSSPSPPPAAPSTQSGHIASTFSPQTTHQRVASAPSVGSGRDADALSLTLSAFSNNGPSRAHWKPDSSTQVCTWPGCGRQFGFFERRHHCRRCGEIFCGVHCSKVVPLDQALDFNRSLGTPCRACVGCSDLYETWLRQGTAAVPPTSYLASSYANGHRTTVQDHHLQQQQQQQPLLHPSKSPAFQGHLSGSNASEGTVGREDAMRLPKSASDTIAIKQKPVQDPNIMPMPSVPHDWSWSTF